MRLIVSLIILFATATQVVAADGQITVFESSSPAPTPDCSQPGGDQITRGECDYIRLKKEEEERNKILIVTPTIIPTATPSATPTVKIHQSPTLTPTNEPTPVLSVAQGQVESLEDEEQSERKNIFLATVKAIGNFISKLLSLLAFR